jgi:hypothetical protein
MNRLRLIVVLLCAGLLIAVSVNFAFAQTSGANNTLIRLGQGYNDVVPRQIVRANNDRLYVFAGAGQYLNRIVGYASTVALPTSSSQFTQIVNVTESANVISVDAVYNGGAYILVTTNLQNGQIHLYVFEVATQTLRPAVTLATTAATISGDYIGSSGLSTAIDLNGNFHLVYWAAGNRLTHQLYQVNNSTGQVTASGASTTVDTSGSASHPSVAVSPADNSLTVTWISEAVTPARILGRLRDAGGTWGAVETVSTGSVWTSRSAGMNIDQGPGLVSDKTGKRYLTYIEPWDSSGFHGRTHWVTGVRSGSSIVWTDQQTPYYSHDPAPAVNSANETFLIGHGNEAFDLHHNMYYRQITPNGGWGPEVLLASPPTGGTFDVSPSVKWAAVGWNRPDAIEFLIFNALQRNFNNTELYYVRFGSSAPGATPTASRTPAATRTPTPTATATATATRTPTATATPLFALLTPANGSTASNQQPVFQWQPAVGAIGYELQLTLGTVASTTVYSGVLTSYTPPTALVGGMAYAWRVRALLAAGGFSPYSVTYTVLVPSLAGSAPLMNFITGSSLVLRWSQVSDALDYEVQVAADVVFTQVVYSGASGGTPGLTVSTLPNGVYWWRVRAVNSGGVGAWSESQSFVLRAT